MPARARAPTSMLLCAILLLNPPIWCKLSEPTAYEMYAAERNSSAETKASTVRRKVPAKYPDARAPTSAINPAKPKAAIMYPITLEIPYERTLNMLS